MIAKIDGKDIPVVTFKPSSSSSLPQGPTDFHSLLQEKMAASRPLDRFVIEYLSQTLASVFLSGEGSTESDSFFLPPLFFELPDASLARNPSVLPRGSINPPTNQVFDSVIQRAGKDYGVDPLLIKAVIQVESAGDPAARSSSGAMGLMQLMPETAAELGVQEPFDPQQNIMAGTRYLRQLLDRYRGDIRLALAAYNWGRGNLESRPEAMPRETKNYITQVEDLYLGHVKT
jgi:hypothetical protein